MAGKQAWRKAWWQVHKWLGLALMILFVPLGLSGVVLAWDDAIDHALNPQRYAAHGAATLAPSAYAAAASGALGPGVLVSQIRYPRKDGPVVVTAMASSRGDHKKHDQAGGGGQQKGGGMPRATVWLDPQSARVLDVQKADGGLIRIAHDFHGSLFVPGGGLGRALVGLLGVAMFLMAVGGIWLWWPPVGGVLKGFRWRRGDRKLDTNLHHLAGLWIALPLAAQAFTGIWMSWPQMMATVGLAPARTGPMERARMMPAADTTLTADQALADARASMPGQPSMIAWPVGGSGQWRVTIGRSEMLVDDATGAASPAPPRPGNGLAMAMRHYHDGTTLGTPWRVLMILFGLSPTLLAITGLTMWLRGRRWRKAAVARKGRVREPVAAA
ncbi:PepSY domain-containing protein [Sphingomonas sp. CGMCC 1.13654]|uniref:PepSY domain-containing protein n=1 Tax=Sphingomonas chungangi TaxID=2683589 RepID=A0A838LA02_9SPHN|nr:PepSY-associated TM helix domain-containing protein [Sphingomonas chungangi]MBA2934946.1 PepSY domain-containing protein [Sphingomonas chungangi]MVW58257.1 PepSY domain-containing protein [Sphingomonas chungangi]